MIQLDSLLKCVNCYTQSLNYNAQLNKQKRGIWARFRIRNRMNEHGWDLPFLSKRRVVVFHQTRDLERPIWFLPLNTKITCLGHFIERKNENK